MQLDRSAPIVRNEDAMVGGLSMGMVRVRAPRLFGRVGHLREAAGGQRGDGPGLMLLAHRQVEVAIRAQAGLCVDRARQSGALQYDHGHVRGPQSGGFGLFLEYACPFV